MLQASMLRQNVFFSPLWRRLLVQVYTVGIYSAGAEAREAGDRCRLNGRSWERSREPGVYRETGREAPQGQTE